MKIKSIKLALLVLIASATTLQASSGYRFDSSIHSRDLFSNTPERRGLSGYNNILNSKPRTYQLYRLNQRSDGSFAKKTVKFNESFHKIFPTIDGKLTLIPHILLSSRLHKHIKLGDKYVHLYWENPNKGHAVFPLTEEVEKKIKSTSNNEPLWITLVKYKKGSDNGLYKILNSNLDLTGSLDIFFGKVDDPIKHKQQLKQSDDSAEPQPETEAPTQAEKPTDTTSHSHAPDIEKDFAIFKEKVMSEMADLKKMINQLMKKMNK